MTILDWIGIVVIGLIVLGGMAYGVWTGGKNIKERLLIIFLYLFIILIGIWLGKSFTAFLDYLIELRF